MPCTVHSLGNGGVALRHNMVIIRRRRAVGIHMWVRRWLFYNSRCFYWRSVKANGAAQLGTIIPRLNFQPRCAWSVVQWMAVYFSPLDNESLLYSLVAALA